MKSWMGEVLELVALRVMATIVGLAGLGQEKEKITFSPFLSKATISGMPEVESVPR